MNREENLIYIEFPNDEYRKHIFAVNKEDAILIATMNVCKINKKSVLIIKDTCIQRFNKEFIYSYKIGNGNYLPGAPKIDFQSFAKAIFEAIQHIEEIERIKFHNDNYEGPEVFIKFDITTKKAFISMGY